MAQHQINWSPGSHGKGFVQTDGSVVTWNIDGPYGAPHHAEMMHDDIDRTPEVHRENHAFNIDPDGKFAVSFLSEDPHGAMHKILNADPRLHSEEKPKDNPFVFGSVDQPSLFATELKSFLDGHQEGEEKPSSPHHETPADTIRNLTLAPDDASAEIVSASAMPTKNVLREVVEPEPGTQKDWESAKRDWYDRSDGEGWPTPRPFEPQPFDREHHLSPMQSAASEPNVFPEDDWQSESNVPDDVQVDHHATDAAVEFDHDEYSWPTIYDHKKKKLYVGDKGAYHWDLMKSHPELAPQYPATPFGPPNPPDHHSHGRIEDGAIEWYGVGAGNPGWTEPNYDDPWHFGAAPASDAGERQRQHDEIAQTIRPWAPGEHGKGTILPDGSIHTWGVGDSSDGFPWHEHYERQYLGVNSDYEVNKRFYIKPDGVVRGYWNNALHKTPLVNQIYDQIGHPDAEPEPEDEWHFGAVEAQPWKPGGFGKGGWHVGTGELRIWATTGQDGNPSHDDVLPPDWEEDRGNIIHYIPFWINPDGTAIISTAVGHDPSQLMQLLTEQGLKPKLYENGDFNFFESHRHPEVENDEAKNQSDDQRRHSDDYPTDGHQMNWTPGENGKGLIIDDKLHTWNVDFSGAPHHFQYLAPQLGDHNDYGFKPGRANEDRPRSVYSEGFDKYYGDSMNRYPMYIDPDGEVSYGQDDPPPEYQALLQAKGHKLEDDPDDWKFGSDSHPLVIVSDVDSFGCGRDANHASSRAVNQALIDDDALPFYGIEHAAESTVQRPEVPSNRDDLGTHPNKIADWEQMALDVDPEPPTVYHVNTGDMAHGDGHAFIYMPDTNKLYLGSPGSYHNATAAEMAMNHGVSYEEASRGLQGRVDPNNLAFYYDWKDHHKYMVRQALQGINGIEENEDSHGNPWSDFYENRGWTDDQWKFAAALPSWQPGQPGKGGITADGEVKTWNVRGDGSATNVGPHHSEGGIVWSGGDSAFWIDADGTVRPMWADPHYGQENAQALLTRHHPDLKLDNNEWNVTSPQEAWKFGKRTSDSQDQHHRRVNEHDSPFLNPEAGKPQTKLTQDDFWEITPLERRGFEVAERFDSHSSSLTGAASDDRLHHRRVNEPDVPTQPGAGKPQAQLKEPVQIVKHGPDFDWMDDNSAWFDPSANQFHVGHPDIHHADILESMGIDPRSREHGMNAYYIDGDHFYPGNANEDEDYSHGPQLAGQLGLYWKGNEQASDWHFGSVRPNNFLGMHAREANNFEATTLDAPLLGMHAREAALRAKDVRPQDDDAISAVDVELMTGSAVVASAATHLVDSGNVGPHRHRISDSLPKVVEQTPPGLQPKQPNQPWKGFWLEDGTVHTWAVEDESGYPHHNDAAKALNLKMNGAKIKDYLWGGHDDIKSNEGPIGGAEQWWEPHFATWDMDDPYDPTQQHHSGEGGKAIPSLDELKPYMDDRECYEWATMVAKKWPHLKQEAGFYGTGDHSWNIHPDGTIIDTTASQHKRNHPVVVTPEMKEYKNYIGYNTHPEQAQLVAHDQGWHDPQDAPHYEYCPKCQATTSGYARTTSAKYAHTTYPAPRTQPSPRAYVKQNMSNWKRIKQFFSRLTEAATIKDEHIDSKWTHGQEGKGLLYSDGYVHTWNTDGNGYPHHYDVDEDILIDGDTQPLLIEADGNVIPVGGKDALDHDEVGYLQSHNPQLYHDTMPQPDWTFDAAIGGTQSRKALTIMLDMDRGVGPSSENSHFSEKSSDWQQPYGSLIDGTTPPGFIPKGKTRFWKGLKFPDGKTYTWDAGSNPDHTHHLDALLALGVEGVDPNRDPDISRPDIQYFGSGYDNHEFTFGSHTPEGAKPWVPGTIGKGLWLPDHNHLMTWQADMKWHHGDAWKHIPQGMAGPATPLHIDKDGQVQNYTDTPSPSDEVLKAHHPALYTATALPDFPQVFGSHKDASSMQALGNRMGRLDSQGLCPDCGNEPQRCHCILDPVQPWKPGLTGKGVGMPDGTLKTWRTYERGGPHHVRVVPEAVDQFGFYDRAHVPFTISPEGGVNDFHEGLDFSSDHHQALQQQGLFPDPKMRNGDFRWGKTGTHKDASDWWEDPDVADYQHGLCDTYALAMLEKYPHLRFGTAYNQYGGHHYFTHDDTHAYDSIGKHPLPYHGVKGDLVESYLDQDPKDYVGPYSYGENGGQEEFERAKQLIPQHHPHLGSLEDWYHGEKWDPHNVDTDKPADDWHFGNSEEPGTGEDGAGHFVPWTPGNWGKGVIVDGDAHIFNTYGDQPRDDNVHQTIDYNGPHHSEIAEHMGAYDVYGAAPITVKPNGEYASAASWDEPLDDSDHMAIQAFHPKLTPAEPEEDDWKFGKVVELGGEKSPDDFFFPQRRPWIYDDQADTFYVGRKGQTHEYLKRQVAKYLNLTENPNIEYALNWSYGSIDDGGKGVNSVSDLGSVRAPKLPVEKLQELAAYLGPDYQVEDKEGIAGGYRWEFGGKVANDTRVFDHDGEIDDMNGYGWRRPFMYNFDQNTMHVGQPGMYHNSLGAELGLAADENAEIPGWVEPDTAVNYGWGSIDDSNQVISPDSDLGSDSGSPSETIPKPALEALRKHVGEDYEYTDFNATDFKFGKQADWEQTQMDFGGGLPQIKHVPNTARGHGMGHAFVHDPNTDTIHLGEPGSYHSDLGAQGLKGRVDPDMLTFYEGQVGYPAADEERKQRIREALKQADLKDDNGGSFQWDENVFQNNEEDWKFGSSDHQIVHVDTETNPYDAWENDRVPLIHLPEHNTTLIGYPGSHHDPTRHQWSEETGNEAPYGSPMMQGYAIPAYADQLDSGRVIQQPGTVTWWQDPGEQVKQDVENHLNVTEVEDQDDWHFASRTAGPTPPSFNPVQLHDALDEPASPPEIYEGAGGVYDLNNLGERIQYRTPFLWHPTMNHVVMGKPGQYHADVAVPDSVPGRGTTSLYDYHHGVAVHPDAPDYINHADTHGYAGTVESYDDDIPHEVLQHVAEHLDKLHKPSQPYWVNEQVDESDEWRFGAAEPVPVKPQIKMHDYDPEDEMGYGTFNEDRMPFIYEKEKNTIHIGPYGSYHADLSQRSGAPYRGTGAIYNGAGGIPSSVENYSGLPPQVMKAVHDHYGLKPEGAAADFHFGNEQDTLFDMHQEDLPTVKWQEAPDEDHGMGHPFIYRPRSKEILVGPAGSYHNAIDPSYSPTESEYALAGRVDPENLSFYHYNNPKWESHYPKIRKALQQHVDQLGYSKPGGWRGWDILEGMNDATAEEGWKFGHVPTEVHVIDSAHGDRNDSLLGNRTPVLWYPTMEDSDAVNREEIQGWDQAPRKLVIGQPGQVHAQVEDVHHRQQNHPPHPVAPFKGAIEDGRLRWFDSRMPSGWQHAHTELAKHFPGVKLPIGKADDLYGTEIYE